MMAADDLILVSRAALRELLTNGDGDPEMDVMADHDINALVEMAVCPRCGCTRSKDIHRPGYSCDYFVSRGHN